MLPDRFNMDKMDPLGKPGPRPMKALEEAPPSAVEIFEKFDFEKIARETVAGGPPTEQQTCEDKVDETPQS